MNKLQVYININSYLTSILSFFCSQLNKFISHLIKHSSVICICLIFFGCNSQKTPVYKNPNKPVEKRVEDLLSKMTLEEKASMISGVNTFFTRSLDRLDIPALRMTDGPLGVTQGKATAFPAGVCMGATWDTALINKVGHTIAQEALAKDRNVLLGLV